LNHSASKFLKYLIAAAAKYPVTKDVEQVYLAKLSKWTLEPEQWDKALDMLIDRGGDGHLPELKDIYEALKNASYHGKEVAGNKAWIYFELKGYSYAWRVYADDGKWRIDSVRARDVHGVETELQKHVGELAEEHYPSEATNVHVAPDNPAREEYA
jgi:hypothetical protein